MRHTFVFDQNKCTGCQACQLACVIENDLAPDASWRGIHTFNERHYPGAPLFHLSLACNHCAEPACMYACPALAYSKDSETGAALIDQGKCIGCRYCTWACPYDAPKFDYEKGVISKCTFCHERIKRGSQPACVELCPTGALTFERLADAEIVNESAGFSFTDMGPSIKIVPLRESRLVPQITAPVTNATHLGELDSLPARVTLRTEWSLALFTLLGAILFALATATVADGIRLSPVLFGALSAAGMALATVHLGRKERAWRAMLNVAHSWLSREIVFFSLFVPTALLHLIANPQVALLGWIVVALGTRATCSMDRVYKFAIKPAPRLHSAGILITGLFLTGVFTLNPVLAVAAGSLKLTLYLWRKTKLAASGGSIRPVASAARLAMGFGLPLSLAVTEAMQLHAAIIAAVLLGELIDRGEFYAEMDIMTPSRQMALDLDTEIQRTQ